MKVLIVDDEPLVRRALQRAFQSAGHEVREAVSGEEALNVWPQFEPDVVFLDVIMPGLTGPQVLEEVEDQKAKVVLMSAYAGDQEVQAGEGARAVQFLAKPFSDVFAVVKMAESLLN
jgi:CheY-like chemotaxis protein